MKKTMKASLLAFALAAAGCSSTNVKKGNNVEAIYNQAVDLIKRERFIEASEYLTEIRTRFPQSRFAQLAELRGADMAFDQGNYTEAAAAYGTFAELYPRHAETPYALYQRALAYYNDAPDNPARDQSPANDAANAAQQLITKFPGNSYAAKAQEIYRQSRLRLAQKEAYVARYYERRNAKLAAFRRWEGLERQFSDLKGVPQADELLAEADRKTKELAGAASEAEKQIQKQSDESVN